MTKAALPDRARAALLTAPLDQLWAQARQRVERNGLRPEGRIILSGLDEDGRRTVAQLLGRPVLAPRVTVDLAQLNTLLPGTVAGCELIELLTRLDGPLLDRRATRDAAATHRSALLDTTRAALLSDGPVPWAEPWLESVRRSGLLTKPDTDRLLRHAVTVLHAVPYTGTPVGRGDLAAQVTGTAHGLDDDSPLCRLVQRALALAAGQDEPTSSEQRRALWEHVGVLPDTVYTTVLVAGLRPTGDDLDSRQLRERADAGVETHLTLSAVRRMGWQLPADTVVHAMENPRVLEAALHAGVRHPLLCIGGNPTVVTLSALDRLRAAGAVVRYHGDFDWPGVAIVNRLVRQHQVQPWRMSAVDYEQATAAAWQAGTTAVPLDGAPVDALWDTELATAMRTVGIAVHEESRLPVLLDDLTRWTQP